MWRPVSNTGATAFADSLGMAGAIREQWLDGVLKDWFKLERQLNGLVQMNTSSKLFGDQPLIYKSGEEWSVDIPGFGKMTVRCDAISNVFNNSCVLSTGNHSRRM